MSPNTHSLYALSESRQAWCYQLTISLEAWDRMEFWEQSLTEHKSHSIWHSPSVVRVVYSDASVTG